MHPIEHLRFLARSSGVDEEMLVREAAYALSSMPDDPAMLVVVCRRLLQNHPTSAPLWWLCSKVLTAPAPSRAAWEAVGELDDDQTFDHLRDAIGDGRTIAVAGWGAAVEALASRHDLVLSDAVVLGAGDMVDAGSAADHRTDVIVVEAVAASTQGVLLDDADHRLLAPLLAEEACAAGRPTAAEAGGAASAKTLEPGPAEHSRAEPGPAERHHVEVIVVCPLGTRIQSAVFQQIVQRGRGADRVVPSSRFDRVIGSSGAMVATSPQAFSPDGPLAPELLLDISGT